MATQTLTPVDLGAAFKNYNTTLTPESFNFSNTISPEATSLHNAPSPSHDGEDHEEGKPTKKRRSWGQQLPTPTTNLPPRKRAKTEAEKEQRRIERVIRNRLAAHSSRERKRKEVECLEDEKSLIEIENQQLKQQLVILASKNRELQQENIALRSELGRPAQALENPITVPQAAIKHEPHDPFRSIPSPPASHVSYSEPRDSLSPAPSSPVADLASFVAASSDLTQHPAEML